MPANTSLEKFIKAEILDFVHEGIMVEDKEGLIVYVNPALQEMLGYASGELIGHHWREIASTSEVNKIGQETKKRALGIKSRYETVFVRKDSGRLNVRIAANPLFEQGEFVGVVAAIVDTTEIFSLKNLLHETEGYITSLLNNSQVAITVVDSKGYLLLFNAGAERLTGYMAEEVIGKHVTQFYSAPKDYEIVTKRLQHLGKIDNYETLIRTKKGEDIPVSISISGSVSVAISLAEVKRLQQHLIETEKIRALGEMAAGVAHDFNNILGIILGRVQLIQIETSDDTILDGLKQIEWAAKDGSNIVRRIQEFARLRQIEEGSILSLNDIITEVIQATEARWKTAPEAKGIQIKVETDFKASPILYGNASEIREVLTNLIFNATDAIEKDGLIRICTDSDEEYSYLTVSDNGYGIAEEILPRVFEPFFTTKQSRGHGLGLSMVNAIIARHRGEIDIESKINEGTSIKVKLPLYQPLTQEAPLASAMKRESVLKEESRKQPLVEIFQTEDLSDISVLVIDDEKNVRLVLHDMLLQKGCSVTIAENGQQGLEKFENGNFDVVLTDLGMAGMSGLELAQEIRKRDEKVGLVLITGWGESFIKKQAIPDHLLDSIISKPFNIHDIAASVLRAAETKKTRNN